MQPHVAKNHRPLSGLLSQDSEEPATKWMYSLVQGL